MDDEAIWARALVDCLDTVFLDGHELHQPPDFFSSVADDRGAVSPEPYRPGQDRRGVSILVRRHMASWWHLPRCREDSTWTRPRRDFLVRRQYFYWVCRDSLWVCCVSISAWHR